MIEIKKLSPVGARLLAIVVAVALAGCGERSGAAAVPPPPVVRVASVLEQDVPISSEWVGTLVGYINAQIRARVAGHLMSQNYKEGSLVRAGDLLFQVDARPFQTAADQADARLQLAESQLSQAHAQVSASQAQVEQALATVVQGEAQVKRAEATQRQTELDVGRYTPLAQRGSVSQQELDNAVQNNLANQAGVAAASAAGQLAGAGPGRRERLSHKGAGRRPRSPGRRDHRHRARARRVSKSWKRAAPRPVRESSGRGRGEEERPHDSPAGRSGRARGQPGRRGQSGRDC